MDFKKKNIFKANSIVLFFAVLGFALLVNFISSRHFIRADLTANKKYTISEGTKKVLSGLNDAITIKAFFSQKLPPNLTALPQYTKDTLEEFKAYSNGDLSYHFYDPADSEAIEKEALTIGIPQAQLNIDEKDQKSIQKVYFGIGIFYHDKKEIIPVVNLPTLEYDLISAIKKVISNEIKVIGVLTGHDEHVFDKDREKNDYTIITELIEQNYKIQNVDLSINKKSEGISTLIIAGPKKALTDTELFAIDQFMINGGTVLFMDDTFKVENGLGVSPVASNLNRIYSSYGIKIINEMVMDKYHADASFSQGNFLRYTMPYPYWVLVLKNLLNQSNPITAKLNNLVFPWISPLQIDKKDGVTVETLASVSDSAWLSGTSPNLNPSQNFQAEPSKLKSYPLIVIVKTKFKSIFQTPPKPEEVSSEANKETLLSPATSSNIEIKKDSDKEGRFLVIANSNFVNDMFVSQFPQNADFFLNVLDFLTIDSTLIEIRSKLNGNIPIKDTSEVQKLALKIVGISAVPILLAGYGIFRMLRRRRKKKMVLMY